MDALEAHRKFERLLADALCSKDPAEAIGRAMEEPGLLEALGIGLATMDGDGLRVSGLLIAKLRFERLLRGSPEVGRWFEADPQGFTRAFRRYLTDVPPTTAEPREERRLFGAWLPTSGFSPPAP